MLLQLHNSWPEPDICVIEFFGKLQMGKESRQVEATVEELQTRGTKKIIFDMSKLDTIDSTGVGVIVMCGGKVRKAGGELRIAGTKGLVHDTLAVTHIDRLVKIYPSVKEASQNFSVPSNASH
jgi:anti-sigma B factor antagonist